MSDSDAAAAAADNANPSSSDSDSQEWEDDPDYWTSRGFEILDNKGKDAEHLDDTVEEVHAETRHSTRTWKKFGRAISQCKNLRELHLGCEMEAESISALFNCGKIHDCPIERLVFYDNELIFGRECVAALLPFLESRRELQYLELDYSVIDDEAIELFAEALNRIIIREVNVSKVMSAQAFVSLFSAVNSKHLRIKELTFDNPSTDDLEAISQFLGLNDCGVEILHIEDSVDLEWVESIFSSLQTNTTLKKLNLGYINTPSGITDGSNHARLIDAMMKLVANKSSLEAFCQSNHVFKIFYYDHSDLFMPDYNALYPPALQRAIRINIRDDISNNQKLRLKLQALYFKDNFDVTPFIEMAPAVIPRLIAFIARSEKIIERDPEAADSWHEKTKFANLNGIYRIIRNMDLSALFYPSRQTKKIIKLQEQVMGLTLDVAESRKENDYLKSENARMASQIEHLMTEMEELRKKCTLPHKRLKP